jgi:hypothetical protein
MPDLPVKETRLSELHLPEIKRDDIVRSLSEMRLPDAVSNFEWPKMERPSVDVGKAVANAAVAAGITRRKRPTWPFAVVGLIVAGVAAVAILTNDVVRARLSGAINAVRSRIAEMRMRNDFELDVERDDAIAFDAAPTAPIEASPFTDVTMGEATGYADGPGSANGESNDAVEASAVTRD